MYPSISLDDLQLVRSVSKHRSLGAAARDLLISQPAASQRLAAIERRLGTALFVRSTTGTSPTRAGQAAGEQALLILDQLKTLQERVLQAAHSPSIYFGAIVSLSGQVFTALDEIIEGGEVRPTIDHGESLLSAVAERTLDAAVISVASQTEIPPTVEVLSLETSPYVIVFTSGANAITSDSQRPYQGNTVVYTTTDRATGEIHAKLASLGARPLPAATAEAAFRIARRRSALVVVPAFVARWYVQAGERFTLAPISRKASVSAVVSRPVATDMLHIIGQLGDYISGPSEAAAPIGDS